MITHFWTILFYTFVYLFSIKNAVQVEFGYATRMLPEFGGGFPIQERSIRMCGDDFLQNLKRVCAMRGIYTPITRQRRSSEKVYEIERLLHRNKRFDDLCTLYAIYEPDQVVTQCCCIGCTRKYLEQFCNPN
uniref:Insulin-like domain-containing protein n=1 Tax=Trichobilharzia regenti TaxID=157069 RepID=A0AA85J0E9_TRIRE|nr:unnamed protein product [Trichobilharzia regenti]